MSKKELIIKNPLMGLGYDTENILPEGGFGAVLASAGVGKTALMVQLALHSLLRSKNVLHISLDDPVNKVGLWYEDVLQNLARENNIDKIPPLWETILPHRFIMTFKVGGFSTPKLEERLSDLTEQDIFSPQLAIIDGLPFDESVGTTLSGLKSLASVHAMPVWFSVRTHRHEAREPEGMPASFLQVVDMFDAVIKLQPEGNETHVRPIKGGSTNFGESSLIIDPATMLVKDR